MISYLCNLFGGTSPNSHDFSFLEEKKIKKKPWIASKISSAQISLLDAHINTYPKQPMDTIYQMHTDIG